MKLKIINPVTLAESAYQGYKNIAVAEEDWKDLPDETKQAWIAAVSKAIEEFISGQS